MAASATSFRPWKEIGNLNADAPADRTAGLLRATAVQHSGLGDPGNYNDCHLMGWPCSVWLQNQLPTSQTHNSIP